MILVAPTAFKGTHSAAEVAAAAARGARACAEVVRELPVSDGGPGLIDALVASGWRLAEQVSVTGPLGTPVSARIAARGNQAAIESADACGLALVPVRQRDPFHTTTYGVGELLRHASGYAHVYAGLGGSATIDGGLGLAAGLRWRLLDAAGAAIGTTGRAVLELARIEGKAPTLNGVTALVDVRNPLFGAEGAARVFGAQKGATPDQIAALDAGLERVAQIIRRDLGIDVTTLPGGGAAGGLGAGLVAFAGAKLVAGSSWVLEQLDFDRLLAQTRLVITGEGAFDAQSGMGKITGEIIARAGVQDVPVLLIAGRVDGALPPHVRAVGNAPLDLGDIERLVRQTLPELLAS